MQDNESVPDAVPEELPKKPLPRSRKKPVAAIPEAPKPVPVAPKAKAPVKRIRKPAASVKVAVEVVQKTPETPAPKANEEAKPEEDDDLIFTKPVKNPKLLGQKSGRPCGDAEGRARGGTPSRTCGGARTRGGEQA